MRRGSEKKNGSSGRAEKVVYLRVTAGEHLAFAAAAGAAQMSVSEWGRVVLRGAWAEQVAGLGTAPRETVVERLVREANVTHSRRAGAGDPDLEF